MTNRDEVARRRVYMKERARAVMGERENLLRFIGASLITLAISGTFDYFYRMVCYFADKTTGALMLAQLILLFFVASPLLMALARMAYRMCASKKTEISDIFYYFNKQRLGGCYVISLSVLGERIVQFALSFSLGRIIAYVFEGTDAYFLSPLALILALLIMPAFSGIFTRAFMLPTAFFVKEDLNEAFSVSGGILRGQSKEIMLFEYSFVPLLLLSVLTFGILFVVYLLPFYMISAQLLALYFVGCRTSENYRK